MRKALNGPATLRRACDAVDQAEADMDRREAVGPSDWWARAWTRANERWERAGWRARAVFDIGPTDTGPGFLSYPDLSSLPVADWWRLALDREWAGQRHGRAFRAAYGVSPRTRWPVGVGGA